MVDTLPVEPAKRDNHALVAALWMVGAILSFSLMAIAGRTVSGTHDTFEVMFFRSCVGVVIIVAVATFGRRWHEVTFNRIGLHFLRNVSHFTGQNLWFFAVGVIPLAQVFSLEFTAPLWALLLSPLILGERVTPVRAMAAGIGFCGILVLTQPFSATLSAGTIAAACAAIGFAGSAVFTRLLTRTETMVAILFYLTVMQAVFGLVLAGFDGDIQLPTSVTGPWLVLIGLAGLFAHFCLTSALKLAPATVVMPIDFARLPLIAVLGFYFYGETVGVALIAGAALILLANWINLRASAREARGA
ncbi:DMT family transporter [Maritimibacter sp. DP1N21-5]|uniref:DMT family transporter n=1 Tax=Maritimibacter sp. DP1N21-5 TaxID=2836867 RepID=UPI001C475923|nr:DMT family transporter [Maritimibacter sp. DP1N21-5]MBV7409823.1 DMT family transporter [Maritimibacter sp. DP1N21-5]